MISCGAVAPRYAHGNSNGNLNSGRSGTPSIRPVSVSPWPQLAPLSATTNLEVALQYSKAEHSLLFKLRTDSFMQRGASVGFLSAFPAEDEVLFPPLTFLKPTGKRTDVDHRGRALTIIEVVPHFGT
jgi:hypothetical protein